MRSWEKGKVNQESLSMQIVKLTGGSLSCDSTFITDALVFSY